MIDCNVSQNQTWPTIDLSVTKILEQGCHRYKHVPALWCSVDRILTYAQLDRLSNRISNYLIAEGVQAGDRIGMCLDRSAEMLAVLLGILKSGAAYVPLDPHYPTSRSEMMIEDASLKRLIVHNKFADRFTDQSDTLVIWEAIEPSLGEFKDSPPNIEIQPEDVAYVIFTSGSTGRPKGIAMPHRALANLIDWQLARSPFKQGARVLQFSSISFDVSFQEISTTLASGGTLYLISDENRRDPGILLKYLIQHRIERLFLPYVALRSLVETAVFKKEYPLFLREIITAGEQLRVDTALRDFFRKISGSILDNQYGPSETHVVTAHLLQGDPTHWADLPPIGNPISNTRAYILDEAMQTVATGDFGELYLAGRSLALGYLNQEEATRRAFVKNLNGNPMDPMLYKTGDLAFIDKDGSIHFQGRKDHQIKIRGHRIEPGEINSAVSKCVGISHSFTHASAGPDGMNLLTTYYTVTANQSLQSSTLREHLSKNLPEYMMPTSLMEIAEIPYTPSGKVDLKALPSPTFENRGYTENDYVYEGDLERRLSKIWAEVLWLEKVPRNATFFDLGGDSLKAVSLFLKIERQFGKDLALGTLAQAPTLRSQAKLIAKDEDELSGYRALQILQKGSADEVPLFLVHGGAGNVLVFSEFVRNLGPKQPVYAFQWPGWDGRPGPSSLEGMARMYQEELLRFIPKGPYRLGGLCFGSWIALEMASQMREEGLEIIEPLVIFDGMNFGSKSYHPEEPETSSGSLDAFADMKSALKRSIEPGTLKIRSSSQAQQDFVSPPGLIPQWLKRIPQVRAVADVLKVKSNSLKLWSFPKIGRTIPVDLRQKMCLISIFSALKKYKSKPLRFPGDILYFRSETALGREMAVTGWWDDICMGFGEFGEGSFDCHVFGADHNGLMVISEMSEHFLDAISGDKHATSKD